MSGEDLLLFLLGVVLLFKPGRTERCLWLGLAPREELNPGSVGPALGCHASGWGGGKCRESILSEGMEMGKVDGSFHGDKWELCSPWPPSVDSTARLGAATWVLTLEEPVSFMAAEVALLHAVSCALQTAV